MRTTKRFVRTLFLLLGAVLLALPPVALPPGAAAEPGSLPASAKFRLGIIGLDTSHAIAFAKLLQDPPGDGDPALQGFRVAAAYPQGSPDIESSVSRVPGYTSEIQKLGVAIVDSIDDLLTQVDGVLLETNDGRPHLEQVLPVLAAKKPVFVDKPVAGSLVDAIAIYEAAARAQVPLFSSSSLRYVPGTQAIRAGAIGEVRGCDAYSPCALEATHPDLFWYGIHGVESLFTVMGPDCESVTRVHTAGTDLAVGVWSGGRVGTFRGIRDGKSNYGGTAFGSEQIRSLERDAGYAPLVVEIAKFFRSGQPPVEARETLAIYAFMEAADESKRQGGVPVRMADIWKQARAEAIKKLDK